MLEGLQLPDLNTIGIWASILGVPIGIAAIAISYFIYKKTQKIEIQQKNNAEGLYVDKTKDGLTKIQTHFDYIFKIIEDHNIEDENDRDLTTSELNLYYARNHGEMVKLLSSSKKSLELWASLVQTKRTKFDKILDHFDWLTHKFFPLTRDDDMRTKIWTTEYQTFLVKKYEIDDILKQELNSTASNS